MFVNPRFYRHFVLGFVLSLTQSSLAQTQPTDYLSELESARKEVIRTDSISIQKIVLGEVHPGTNHLSALATNNSDDAVTVALDLRADPGLLVLPKWQSQFCS